MTGKMHSYFNGRRFRTLIFQSLAVALLLIVGLVPVAHAQESTAAPSSGEVSVVRLNLRTEPSISSPVAGRLAQGTVVEILSVSDDGRWYEIATSDDRTGWLYAVYVNTTPTTAAQSTSTETSVALSTGDAVATPVATTLSVDEPGNYQGVWTFPVIRPGEWSLTYSCQTDYSSVPIADVRLGAVGFAEYSSRYYVTVLSATRTGASSVEVRFASHGDEYANNDLRDPLESCLIVDGRSTAATSVSYATEIPGQFYDGRLTFDFVPVADIEFLYSCQNDYSSVALPDL